MKKTRKADIRPPVRPRAEATPASFLSPAIFDAPDAGLFGHIDTLSDEIGIEGWVLDCASPGRVQDVRLLVGETVIASVRTGQERPDIVDIINKPVLPGFRLGPEVFDQIRGLANNSLPISLQVDDGAAQFDLSTWFTTVGGCKTYWVDQRLSRLGRQDVGHSEASRLLDRLEDYAAKAASLAERPLFPQSERRVGVIEGVHSAGSGALWFIGWVRRDTPDEFPAVIVDRRRYPSAGAVMRYEKPDLESEHVGVIGFILTVWKPSTAPFHLYLGEDAALQIGGGSGTRAMSADEILSQFESVRNLVSGGSVSSLRALLTSGGNWLPNNARAVGVAAEAALDKVVIVPSFGAFVEGWAICPARRVKGFALKIGDCILNSDPLTTFFRERADLASVFPDGGLYTGSAGFGAVLVGPVTTADIGAALLKVIYTDDSSSVHAVDSRVIRRFNAPEDSQPLLRQWPALEHEPFMPALARAAHRDWMEGLAPPSPVAVAPAHAALVIVLPEGLSNLRAQADLISRHIHKYGAPSAVVFLAEQRELRSEALRVINDLRVERGIQTSLWFIGDDNAALALLPHILRQMETERFVFSDLGVLLSDEGWRAAVTYLATPIREPLLFQIVDHNSEPDRVGGALGASCFGWNIVDFATWYQGAVIYVPGPTLDRSFRHALAQEVVVKRAAQRIEFRRTPRLVEIIDGALHASLGTSA